MPAKRLSTGKIKDVLRLCWGQGLSKRKAAGSCGVSRPTVDEYLHRAELAAGLDEGALGASNYTYAEATWTQGLEDWIGAHVRCFTYLGGSLHVKRVAGFSEIRTIIATL